MRRSAVGPVGAVLAAAVVALGMPNIAFADDQIVLKPEKPCLAMPHWRTAIPRKQPGAAARRPSHQHSAAPEPDKPKRSHRVRRSHLAWDGQGSERTIPLCQ